MNVVIGIFILIGYLAIGIILNGAINERRQDFSILIMILWPLVLAYWIVFGFIALLFWIGEGIRDTFMR